MSPSAEPPSHVADDRARKMSVKRGVPKLQRYVTTMGQAMRASCRSSDAMGFAAADAGAGDGKGESSSSSPLSSVRTIVCGMIAVRLARRFEELLLISNFY